MGSPMFTHPDLPYPLCLCGHLVCDLSFGHFSPLNLDLILLRQTWYVSMGTLLLLRRMKVTLYTHLYLAYLLNLKRATLNNHLCQET